MADPAGRGPGEPVTRPAAAEEDQTAYNGWGSPVPAEYGSLRAARPPRPAPARTPRQAGAAGASVSALLKRLQGGDGQARTAGNGARAKTTQPGRTRSDTGRTAAGGNGQAVRSAAVDAASAAAAITVSESATGSAPTPLARSGSAAVPTSSPRTRPSPATPGSRRYRSEKPPTITKQQRREAATLRAQRARARATVRHIDIWTVVRVSVVFFLIAAIIIVGASMLLWYAADAFGTLPSIEKSIRTLFGLKSFKIHAGAVAEYMMLAGLVLVVAGAIASVLAALVYNLISDVVGGVRIELEAPRPRRPVRDRPEV
jgi:Transmembrane domain of unknown function (DUF3566)